MMNEEAVGRFRLHEKGEERVVLGLMGTSYRIYARPTGAVSQAEGKRVKGVVRLPVWKVDFVSAGGAFVEPVWGRPRRVHGDVVGTTGEGNELIVDVWDTPMVAELPARWRAEEIKRGTRVGLDVYEGARFEPVG